MSHLRKKPAHPALAEYIDCYWGIKSESSSEPFVHLPDGTIDLVFNSGSPYLRESVSISGTGAKVSTTTLCVQRKCGTLIKHTGKIDIFCIRFKEYGLYSFYNKPLHEYSDFTIEPKIIFGDDFNELQDKIHSANSFNQKVELSEAFFIRRLKYFTEIDPDLKSLSSAVRFHKGRIKIAELAGSHNTGLRNIERKFREQIGISVKDLAKIHRFNFLLFLKERNRNEDLTRLALDAGFYDSSHMIKDFRFFTGTNPTSFFNSQQSFF